MSATRATARTRAAELFRRWLNRKGATSAGLGVFFDEQWYLAQYEDVRNARVDPLDHYDRHGWREGRWPNPIFDPAWYRARYPDVAALDTDPLRHFATHGRFEGRQPSAQFDPRQYAARHPELVQSGADASEHYLSTGKVGGRTPGLTRTDWRARAIESFGDLSARDLRMMARETRAHLAGLDGMFVPWRSALLSKLVYELDEPRQPVPDGLSLRYLALAADMRRVAERRDGPAFRGDDQVAFGERAIQDEIAKAQQLERRLLDRISRIGAGRRS